jgi:uncharacterized protein affecting Mg2+/Co2+ transport
MQVFNSDVLLEIFKFLTTYHLASVLSVSKTFYHYGTKDYLWASPCKLLFLQPESSYYQHFIKNIYEFLKISNSFYDILCSLGASGQKLVYNGMLSASNPILSNIIPKYKYINKASNPILNYSQFCLTYGIFPIDLYWVYLLYNGQHNSQSGLFGSYQFYDVYVSLDFLPVRPILEFYTIASSRSDQRLRIFIDIKNKIGKGEGAVYCNSGLHNTVLYLSPSFSSYLQEYSLKIKTGVLSIREETINLYENNRYASEHSLEGIKINASALYVPHLSREDRHLWTYQITIGPDNPTKQWRLTTRSWKITASSGKEQTVDKQPGVIGLYPKVYKNSPSTVYTSCCYLDTPSGVMTGFFTFSNINNPDETIDVPVAPFRLELPENSELIDVSFL